MFELIDILHHIYGLVGPAGTGIAAIFLIAGSMALGALNVFARGDKPWGILSGAVVTMIIAGWLFHHHQHSESRIAAQVLEGKWRGADANCDYPMVFTLEELSFGETDLVVTTADLPHRYAVYMQESTPDLIVVHSLPDKAVQSYRREGDHLVVSADAQPQKTYYRCP
ncbi:MAG: hypothetical protein WDM91_14200 [Rhizomicrobium sp.]